MWPALDKMKTNKSFLYKEINNELFKLHKIRSPLKFCNKFIHILKTLLKLNHCKAGVYIK